MYSIGQILYVVLSKKSQVYPMQVIEVITKKTLNGEEIRYSLRGGSDKSSTVYLDQIDGEVFESADIVRQTLVQRATSQINKLVDTAISKSNEWYNSKSDISTNQKQELLTNEKEVLEEENIQTIMMPDGSIAKIKLPSIV